MVRVLGASGYMMIRVRLASVAVMATLAGATSAPALAGATPTSKTVGQQFGCSFKTWLSEDFYNHIAPVGAMRCNRARIADLRLALLRNGVPQRDIEVLKHHTVPTKTDAFAPPQVGIRCSPAWYRSELTVRLFHNGTSTVLRAESPRVFLRPSTSRPALCY